jgi:hypothetical protein
MNKVTVSPAGSSAYGVRERGLMLRAVRERAEFDWRF